MAGLGWEGQGGRLRAAVILRECSFDARFHVPRIGRIKISFGLDAVDGTFSTIYGGATLSYFQVWAYQVPRGTVGVGDPLDCSRRLDNRHEVQAETPYSVGRE